MYSVSRNNEPGTVPTKKGYHKGCFGAKGLTEEQRKNSETRKRKKLRSIFTI